MSVVAGWPVTPSTRSVMTRRSMVSCARSRIAAAADNPSSAIWHCRTETGRIAPPSSTAGKMQVGTQAPWSKHPEDPPSRVARWAEVSPPCRPTNDPQRLARTDRRSGLRDRGASVGAGRGTGVQVLAGEHHWGRVPSSRCALRHRRNAAAADPGVCQRAAGPVSAQPKRSAARLSEAHSPE